MPLDHLVQSDFACESMEFSRFSGIDFSTEYVTVRARCDHGFAQELTFTLAQFVQCVTPDEFRRAFRFLVKEAFEWHGPPPLMWLADLGWFDAEAST